MGVRYALLGLLEEKPDYGYRLRKRFEERVGEVWRVNLGQAYQTLHAMNDEGLICQVSTDADATLDDEALERIAAQEKIYARHLTKLVRRKRKVAKATYGPELVALLSIEAAEAHAEAHLDWLDTCRKRLTADPERLGSEDVSLGE